MDQETAEIAVLKKVMTNDERLQFDVQYSGKRKSPGTAVALSVLLGMAGVDRFYIGDIGLGVFKLVTIGGLGIFYLFDWFLISGATRRNNLKVARGIATSLNQLRP